MRASKFCLPVAFLMAAWFGPVAFAQGGARNKSAPVASATALANPMSDGEKAEMAERVRAAALHAWNGNKKYAWGHDALTPLCLKPFDCDVEGHRLVMTPGAAL